ncbi:MAG: Regulatory protein [Actinomycetia bacterium]|nr:Regulatory protein [Actinomycetes bacterium]
MSVTMVFGPDDPARTRFVISPAWETMHAIRVIAEPQRHLYHLPWLEAVRPQAERLDLRPLLMLTPRRGWTPDFLSPVPDTPAADMAGELARVRATPPEQVAHEVRRSLTERYGAPVPPGAWQLLEDPAATRDLVADLLAQSWELLVEPHWPRLRDRIEADVAFRTRMLADYGLERMLGDLHPRVRWTGRALVIKGMDPARRLLDGAGLMLMPSAFAWPSLAAVIDPPSRPALVYPARGIAELWQPARTPQSDALARLLGRTRAALLESLAEPASTHTLARRHGLAPSTVSEHLSALRDARLVSSGRHRHAVMYQQTRLGAALADAG